MGKLDIRSVRFVVFFLCIIVLSISASAQKISREISIKNVDQYLNFPVSGWSSDASGQQVMMRIKQNGKVLDEFSVNLANRGPDWWAFFPVERYQGNDLVIELDDSSRKSGLNMISAAAHIKNYKDIYSERYRQQVHFTHKRGWNNDPNGMIYYGGQWHLFFQYNPFGWSWGNMHWGHAVSNDLVHWKEWPIALYSPDHDHMAFSGGAVADPNNTGRFRKNGVDPLIATYTRTGSGEHLALSYDNGKTFEEYNGNPVVKHEGRDPVVFWYKPRKHWVMAVYDESHFRTTENGKKVRKYQTAIYTSKNLKNWTYQSGVSTMFECPQLFELPVEGEAGVSKWVIYDGNGKYYVGTFDGKKFTKEQGLRELDHGGAFYASQTFSNVPKKDGRRIQIGWFQTETPFMPFNQSMTFPTELKLRKVDGNYVLMPTPIREIEKLHTKRYHKENLDLNDTTFDVPVDGGQLHIIVKIDREDAKEFGLNINGFNLNYNRLRTNLNGTFYPIDQKVKFEIIVDKVGMEIFVDDGMLYYAISHNSVDNEKKLQIFAKGGSISVDTLDVYRLESIWKTQKKPQN